MKISKAHMQVTPQASYSTSSMAIQIELSDSHVVINLWLMEPH